jgi:pyridoxal/pyridoxine/pyridoxamine kinase
MLRCRKIRAVRGPLASQIVTSMPDIEDPSSLILLGSSVQDGDAALEPAVFTIKLPRMNVRYTGTGDLFAAVFLGRMADNPSDIAKAAELVRSCRAQPCPVPASKTHGLLPPGPSCAHVVHDRAVLCRL